MAVNVVIGLYYYLAWAASLYSRLRPGGEPAVVPDLLVRRPGDRHHARCRRCGCRSRPAWCCGSAERATRTPAGNVPGPPPAFLHRAPPRQRRQDRRPARRDDRADPARGRPGSAAAAGSRSPSLIALGTNGFAYFFSDKLALRSMRARPVSEAEQPAHVPDRPRAVHRGPAADAAALRLADQRAQRVRDRPQPAQRRGLLHRGHPRACSTSASCAGCSATSCRTSTTATS